MTGNEQPLPEHDQDSKPVFPEVIKDIEARMAQGIRTYGKALHTFNGRSALQDLYEELLDSTVYIKQILMELEALDLKEEQDAEAKLDSA